MNKEILENMPTSDLDEILNAELQKDLPDGDLVRAILRVLEEREKDQPVEITPEIQAAWDKFNQKDQRRANRPEPRARSWVICVASAAAVICILVFVIPVQAQAESWWERVARWTDSFFEFVAPGEAEETEPEYVFQTDNPGLQEVYDAVTDLGVTVPVVPMWLPEGYELVSCDQLNIARNMSVVSFFSDGEKELAYRLYILNENTENKYQKNEGEIGEFEFNGVTHYLARNKEMWTVAWTKGVVECVLSVECEEEILHKIIWSIYITEGFA